MENLHLYKKKKKVDQPVGKLWILDIHDVIRKASADNCSRYAVSYAFFLEVAK